MRFAHGTLLNTGDRRDPVDKDRPSSISVLLFAPQASALERWIDKPGLHVTTWVLVLDHVDRCAQTLKQRLERRGEECLVIQADFHERGERLQAIAMAEDFAGQLTFLMDGTAWEN